MGKTAVTRAGQYDQDHEGEGQGGRGPRRGHGRAGHTNADVRGSPRESGSDESPPVCNADGARTRAQEGDCPEERGAAADDSERHGLEHARRGRGHTEGRHPRGRAGVCVHSPARRGKGGPRRGAREDGDVGGHEKRQSGQRHEEAAPGPPRERECANRQQPRGAARQNNERKRRAPRVHSAGLQGCGLNAGCTGHVQRPGRPEAERREDGQGDVGENAREDTMGRAQEECGGECPRQRRQEAHAQRRGE